MRTVPSSDDETIRAWSGEKIKDLMAARCRFTIPNEMMALNDKSAGAD
jgi:hypothetical protein